MAPQKAAQWPSSVPVVAVAPGIAVAPALTTDFGMANGYNVYQAQLPAGRNCFGGHAGAGNNYVVAVDANLDGLQSNYGDVSTCCDIATCTAFSITFPNGHLGYTVSDHRGSR